jgi:hypothetical protein
MALQDVDRAHERRAFLCREGRSRQPLSDAKVTYDELSVIADKGVPASKAFAGEDLAFLGGGLGEY